MLNQKAHLRILYIHQKLFHPKIKRGLMQVKLREKRVMKKKNPFKVFIKKLQQKEHSEEVRLNNFMKI